MRITRIMLFLLAGVFIMPATLRCENIDIGQIIEKSPDGNYIQVHDWIYRVGKVEVHEEKDKQYDGSSAILSTGDIVKIIKGEKKDDYWETQLIIVYKGQLAKQKRQEMELPDIRALDESKQSPGGKNKSHKIIFENGVWHN